MMRKCSLFERLNQSEAQNVKPKFQASEWWSHDNAVHAVYDNATQKGRVYASFLVEVSMVHKISPAAKFFVASLKFTDLNYCLGQGILV